MIKKSSVPGSIEGCTIEICAQKIDPDYRPFLTTKNDIVFPVKASRSARGNIVVEYVPKKAKVRTSSLLDLGDGISGKYLWGFSASPVTKINVGKKGRTSSHPGQDTQIDGCSGYLEIIMGWFGQSILTHPKNELLISS